MTTACSEKVLQTWATAMDIQVPYNVERIVLMAAGLDTARVAALMKQFEADTAVKLPEDLRAAVRGVVVDSVMVESGEMVETMRRCHRDNGGQYTICPHTAVGVAFHYQHPGHLPQVGGAVN